MTPLHPRAPLASRARFAWGFAFTARTGTNPVVREQCRQTLAIALCDPHPRIRRLAGDSAARGPATVYPLDGRAVS